MIRYTDTATCAIPWQLRSHAACEMEDFEHAAKLWYADKANVTRVVHPRSFELVSYDDKYYCRLFIPAIRRKNSHEYLRDVAIEFVSGCFKISHGPVSATYDITMFTHRIINSNKIYVDDKMSNPDDAITTEVFNLCRDIKNESRSTTHL